MSEREHLDYRKPKKESELKPALDVTGLSLRQKLEVLNELLVDSCIANLSTGIIKPNDLGAIVTLLKNNKVIEERRELSESEILDGLIE